jgi:sporulation protein YtfJ
MSHPLPNMMGASIEKIREMVDVNTVIGDPIRTSEGVTIIPVSKVKIGYAGGGSDFITKNYPATKDNAFGGGAGAGVTITPVAFLVIKGESVRMLPVTTPPSGSVERLVELLPELIDQLSGLLKKKDPDPAGDAAE